MTAAIVPAGVVISADVCAAIGPALRSLLDEQQRRNGIRALPAIAEALAAIEQVGRAERARRAGELPHGIPQPTPPGIVEGMSTATAARHLGITERAVRARLERGTLAGERTPTGWRVFIDTDDESEHAA